VDERHYRRIFGLTSRVVEDAAALSRALRIIWPRQDDGVGHEVVRATSSAIASVANAVEGSAPPDLSTLRRMLEERGWDTSDLPLPEAPAALLAGPLWLLTDDLQQLLRVSGKLATEARTVAQ
jgi:hypothetical protein